MKYFGKRLVQLFADYKSFDLNHGIANSAKQRFPNTGFEILLICRSTLQADSYRLSNSWIEFIPAGYRWNACRRYARLVAWGPDSYRGQPQEKN